MLELKVRPLTTSEIEFLHRWDAEDDDTMRDFLLQTGRSPIYARNFGCTHCGWGADEYVTVSPSNARLWLWSSSCWDMHCPAYSIKIVPFTAWTGFKINEGRLVPLNTIVPEQLGGEIVWRRGIATFRTIMQACAASPRDVRKLGLLQTLKGIA
jgi:hypothetical protein